MVVFLNFGILIPLIFFVPLALQASEIEGSHSCGSQVIAPLTVVPTPLIPLAEAAAHALVPLRLDHEQASKLVMSNLDVTFPVSDDSRGPISLVAAAHPATGGGLLILVRFNEEQVPQEILSLRGQGVGASRRIGSGIDQQKSLRSSFTTANDNFPLNAYPIRFGYLYRQTFLYDSLVATLDDAGHLIPMLQYAFERLSRAPRRDSDGGEWFVVPGQNRDYLKVSFSRINPKIIFDVHIREATLREFLYFRNRK